MGPSSTHEFVIGLLLDAVFHQLSLRKYTITTNSFDTLGVKSGFYFVNIFIFETDIALLG